MHTGKLVFAQVMEFAPWHTFRRLVAKYRGDFNVRTFSCLDQFLCMAFAQLTYRESLRDVEACLRAQPSKLYHLGLRGYVSRNSLAHANELRDWRIYCDFAQALIRIARRLYAKESLGIDLSETVVYALDSTTIDLCLSLFPWARFRKTKAAIKLHTLLDLRGGIPSFIHISDGTLHDVNVLDVLITEPGAFYVMDRGYLAFNRLYTLHQAGSFFVTRTKSNTQLQRLYSRPVDRATGLLCDQIVEFTGFYSLKDYPERLRRIRYRDAEGRPYVFLTNHMTLPALTICDLYRLRWQVELFFKWIKQHLRIKRFFGTSDNAVKTQVWIAVTVYVLIAIIRKQLQLPLSLHGMLQILSVTPFENVPLFQLLTEAQDPENFGPSSKQLNLF